ncbi:MAG: DUF5683 domain-containing protein [Cyclobacteriaceae bacterium]|jgi:hypothetical protein|nr:DUF5683 domain-containing protein [Flammeovirgaceae bacterium]
MKYVGWVMLILLSGKLVAQNPVKGDTTTVLLDSALTQGAEETVEFQSMTGQNDPRKALLYSAILPGSGQIYNKKYWKVPIVWGGLGVLVYAVDFYNQGYTQFRSELFGVLQSGDTFSPSGYNESQLRTLTDAYRRQRDFFVVLTGIFYLVQLVDAHVDAHLKEFEVNPRLKISLRPQIENSPLTGATSGLALTLRF